MSNSALTVGSTAAGNVGTAGQVLTSNGAGALPTFQAAAGAWTLISSATASASAALDFTGLSSTYSAYVAVLTNILPATDNVELYLRTSTNGGSSYDASSGNYVWKAETNYGAGVGTYAAYGESSTATYIGLTATSASYQLSNSAGEGWSGSVEIYQPSAAANCKVRYKGSYIATTGGFTFIDGAGYRAAAADVDAIRFLCSSGNIASGTIYLYGLRAS